MKNLHIAITLTLVTIICLSITPPLNAEAANSWVGKAPMQVARANLGVAVVDGYIYAIGGNTFHGTYCLDQGFTSGFSGEMVTTNERYDPATDNWTFKEPIPTPRDCFAIATYDGKIYCIGGRTSVTLTRPQTFTSINEVYDAATDTWQTKAPLPTTGWPLQANVVKGKIYVMDRTGATFAYDPTTDTWSTKAKATLNSPEGQVSGWATGFVAGAIGDKIYAVGGISANSYYGTLNVIYDTTTDTWSQALSTPLYTGGGGLLGLGGLGAGAATTGSMAPKEICFFFKNNTYIYDPIKDTWTMGTALPNSLMNLAVAVVNDTFYVIGGANEPQDIFDYYDPLAVNEQYFPSGYGTPDPSYVRKEPPRISVLSPVNQTFNEPSLQLVFTADEALNWAGYCFDGKENVTIGGNVTIEKIADGGHYLKIYANDTFGNMGASGTVNFSVKAINDSKLPSTVTIGVAIVGTAAATVLAALAVKKYGTKAPQN